MYQKLTKEAADKVERVAKDETLNANEAMKKVVTIEESIKFASFGKPKPTTNKKKATKSRACDKELLEYQSKRVEEEILKVESDNRSKVGRIYSMKKEVTGEKQREQEPVAVRDPDNNQLVVAREEIKKVTLKYCKDNLKKKDKDECYSEDDKIKQELHEARMKDEDDDGFELTKEDFDDVIEKLKRKSTKAYDFLTKADDEYKAAIFMLCKKFIENEEFPDMFKETMLYMIWKKKGGAETLKNNRFIHLKHHLARLCEALVFNKYKNQIFDQSTKYQIGGQSGHSPEEHVFSLKSLMSLKEFLGEGVILNLVDIVSFFDREDIIDVIEALEDMNVNKKVLRIWYKLNDNTNISVKTSVGMTEKTEVGALVGQGSGGAAIGSQAMVDIGLKNYLSGSRDEIYYGEVRMESASFQDDILKPSSDVFTAQAGMTRLAGFLEERGLDAHQDKTSYLVCGTEEYKAKTNKLLKEIPLQFGDFLAKRKVMDKYLGQVLHEDGLEASVRATIQDRTGKIKGAIFLTKSIIETYQMQGIGAMAAAKVLWEGAIVPSLLHGAGTWIGSSKETDQLCEELQLLFWRTAFQVPKSTPKVMLRAQTKSTKMKQRIWKLKLMMARKILYQEGSLAHEIYEEQLKHDWPGLAKEVKEICEEIGVKNINEEDVSKEEVDDGIFYHNYKEMKLEICGYKKLEAIKNDDFTELPEYMNDKSLENSRMSFRIKSSLVNRIKMNFKGSYKHNLVCEKCESGQNETQCHAMSCAGWSEQREGLDLEKMSDMVIFFRRLLEEKGGKKTTEGLP